MFCGHLTLCICMPFFLLCCFVLNVISFYCHNYDNNYNRNSKRLNCLVCGDVSTTSGSQSCLHVLHTASEKMRENFSQKVIFYVKVELTGRV